MSRRLNSEDLKVGHILIWKDQTKPGLIVKVDYDMSYKMLSSGFKTLHILIDKHIMIYWANDWLLKNIKEVITDQ